jgi:hypothetical protein
MLNGQTFYHGAIRKTIVAFGRLFSDIKIERQLKDGTETVDQTLAVPLSYAPKEKWLVRIEQDPNLTNHTYIALPRMSFEITGYAYDSTRKLNKMNKITCNTATSENAPLRSNMLAPVPYNIDISLYILTKTQEDAMQILEQILPTFTPEYTLSINAVPEMNVVQDIPIVLNSITVQDDYDGDFETRRFVTHTLNFTIKTNIFGNVSKQGIINTTIVNTTQTPTTRFTATASIPGGPIEENWEENL